MSVQPNENACLYLQVGTNIADGLIRISVPLRVCNNLCQRFQDLNGISDPIEDHFGPRSQKRKAHSICILSLFPLCTPVNV